MGKIDKTNAERSKRRRERLDEIAHQHGFESWRRLETAVLNGQAKVVKVTVNKEE